MSIIGGGCSSTPKAAPTMWEEPTEPLAMNTITGIIWGQ